MPDKKLGVYNNEGEISTRLVIALEHDSILRTLRDNEEKGRPNMDILKAAHKKSPNCLDTHRAVTFPRVDHYGHKAMDVSRSKMEAGSESRAVQRARDGRNGKVHSTGNRLRFLDYFVRRP
ncbi:hypothetical protein CLAIMM_03620 [Cladophialophora immunda]|nr:hypothetical protein CLAIMM_03620 [Cladophialophora immunda]